MKIKKQGEKHGWRAQKGCMVRYAKDRQAGTGLILEVIPGAPHLDDGTFRIKDINTGVELIVSTAQIKVLVKD